MMDCFPDFCLSCDSQISHGLYCSEACRLVDLSKGSVTGITPVQQNYFSLSEETIPMACHTPSTIESSTPPSRFSTSLPSSYTRPNIISSYFESMSMANLTTTISSPVSSSFMSLSPSSSGASLSSHRNYIRSGTEALSDSDTRELMNYFNAFDTTRKARTKTMTANKSIRMTIGETPRNISDDR